MEYITITILKWNILPQQKGLPSIRCVEEKTTECKQYLQTKSWKKNITNFEFI